jgi:DNA polymerase alpha-associated DNA helicase A
MYYQTGTGKTHTLIELILQLLSKKLRILVCGASNLSVDNILERLVALPKKTFARPLPEMHLLRISHPTRTLAHLVPTTLDFQSKHSESGALVRDCKSELDEKIAVLISKKGEGVKSRGRKIRLSKEERKKGWEEVRQLRKEYIFPFSPFIRVSNPRMRN